MGERSARWPSAFDRVVIHTSNENYIDFYQFKGKRNTVVPIRRQQKRLLDGERKTNALCYRTVVLRVGSWDQHYFFSYMYLQRWKLVAIMNYLSLSK